MELSYCKTDEGTLHMRTHLAVSGNQGGMAMALSLLLRLRTGAEASDKAGETLQEGLQIRAFRKDLSG